jgi:hypothetical protein
MLVALFATRVVRRYQIRTLLHEAARRERKMDKKQRVSTSGTAADVRNILRGCGVNIIQNCHVGLRLSLSKHLVGDDTIQRNRWYTSSDLD